MPFKIRYQIIKSNLGVETEEEYIELEHEYDDLNSIEGGPDEEIFMYHLNDKNNDYMLVDYGYGGGNCASILFLEADYTMILEIFDRELCKNSAEWTDDMYNTFHDFCIINEIVPN